jgi:hypothetical protein
MRLDFVCISVVSDCAEINAIENRPSFETNVRAPTTDGALRWTGSSIAIVIAMIRSGFGK